MEHAGSTETDRVLVQAYLQSRDERSFRDLYRRYTPALYGLALRWCDSAEDAQDAIQNMWVRACGALSTFQWKSSLKTWLTGVLINCLRELNRRSEPESIELSDEHPGPPNVEPEKLNVEKAIASLPLGYRQVLTLHDVEGYTHEEISELLNVSVGTSKSQLHHARKAFKAAFLNGANHDERIRR